SSAAQSKPHQQPPLKHKGSGVTESTSNPPNSLISSHPEFLLPDPQIPPTSSPRFPFCRSASSATPAAHLARYPLAESYSPAYLATSLLRTISLTCGGRRGKIWSFTMGCSRISFAVRRPKAVTRANFSRSDQRASLS